MAEWDGDRWVEGEAWEPDPDSDDACNVWVSAREAASMLGLCVEMARYLARKGKLPYGEGAPPGKPFRLYAVSRLLRERERAEEKRTFAQSVSGERSRERRAFIRRWAAEPLAEGDELITRQQAAEVLGVSPRRVSMLVTQGRLWAEQEIPGRSGSRMWFRLSHVTAYWNRPERIEHRRRHDKGVRDLHEPVSLWEERGIGPLNPREQSARTLKDYGEFYTSRQVAILLGIGVGTLKELRKRGRLQGYTRERKNGPLEPAKSTRGRTWWFYRKADVDALLADPIYCEMTRRYRKRIEAAIPNDADIMAILDAGVATARENARRRERERAYMDLA
jgi:hypothetical protein